MHQDRIGAKAGAEGSATPPPVGRWPARPAAKVWLWTSSSTQRSPTDPASGARSARSNMWAVSWERWWPSGNRCAKRKDHDDEFQESSVRLRPATESG